MVELAFLCLKLLLICVTLHLLYVLLIQLHFVVVKRMGRICAKTPFALTAVSSLRARSWGGGRRRKGGLAPPPNSLLAG